MSIHKPAREVSESELGIRTFWCLLHLVILGLAEYVAWDSYEDRHGTVSLVAGIACAVLFLYYFFAFTIVGCALAARENQ